MNQSPHLNPNNIIIVIIIHLSWSWATFGLFRSHVSRSLYKGLPWFFLPVKE